MAVRKTQKLKKNIEGFRDYQGIFHPIRSGEKEGGARYLPGLAGDNDDVFDKEIRKEKNQKKAEEYLQKKALEDALQDALGDAAKVSLSQFVRNSGGLFYDPSYTDVYNGELAGLSYKESKIKGIAHKNGKKSLDEMREAADEAGYANLDGLPLTTINDFLDALNADMSGKKLYPFGTIGAYKFNPSTHSKFLLKKQAANITRVIKKLEKKGGRSRKIANLKKLKETILKLANRPATPTLKKNGLIGTLAEIGVAATSGVALYDRFKEKKPVKAKKIGRAYVGSLETNPKRTTKTAKRKTAKKNPSFEKSADPKQSERIYERHLVAIENGDLSPRTKKQAEIYGKLAGFTANEIRRSLQYSRLTHLLNEGYKTGKLKSNPAHIKAAEALILKSNGLIGRALARHRAGSLYKKQLRLEAALERAKAKRSKAEGRAKKNPVKKAVKKVVQKPIKKVVKRTKKNPVSSKSFEAFQGRKPTKVLELPRAADAPKNLWSLGKLFELRLKGKPDLNFRREVTGKTFYVCAPENNKQIWICGGTVATPNNSIAPGFSEPYAQIAHIVYETEKTHLGDTDKTGYIHRFGEEGGELPTLAFDRDGFPIIVAGSYTITPLGIAD